MAERFKLALLAETKSKLLEITTNLQEAAGKAGLRISTVKTKMMENGTHSNVTASVTVGQQYIDDVDHFTYLGSIVTPAMYRQMSSIG